MKSVKFEKRRHQVAQMLFRGSTGLLSANSPSDVMNKRVNGIELSTRTIWSVIQSLSIHYVLGPRALESPSNSSQLEGTVIYHRG